MSFCVGPSVVSACLRCLNDGESLEAVNDTLVVLIPKVKFAERINEFRPISLCNVIYKIVLKALVNRFRLIIGEMVSESQSAVNPGRLISDNTIIVFECLHTIRTKRAVSGAIEIVKRYPTSSSPMIASFSLKLLIRIVLLFEGINGSSLMALRIGSDERLKEDVEKVLSIPVAISAEEDAFGILTNMETTRLETGIMLVDI
ncbi:hypothetical protein Ddye_024041 [Dipteronia dyeriana]|uniref:Reverse transcriptase n=1 Tax=Dipteronia dyeriana TaxID=168575 RepID=A0AAD9TV38_9ROSI|nr:hypothetical protein Ddye_024041 [Dipteronia dyeriana]